MHPAALGEPSAQLIRGEYLITLGLVDINTVLYDVGRQMYFEKFVGDTVIFSRCFPPRYNKHWVIHVAGLAQL